MNDNLLLPIFADPEQKKPLMFGSCWQALRKSGFDLFMEILIVGIDLQMSANISDVVGTIDEKLTDNCVLIIKLAPAKRLNANADAS